LPAPRREIRGVPAIHRHLPLFLLAASLIRRPALYCSFGTLHWRAEGPDSAIWVLWSIGVIAEVALFAASARVIASVGTARLLMLAGLAAALRWSVMALDPPLVLLGPLQTLHAMSFGAAHVSAIHFLTHAVPEDRAATAQGLYAAAVAGIALGTATLASGPLYASFAGAAYGAMALLALAGAACAYRLTQLWREGPTDAAAIETSQSHEIWPPEFGGLPLIHLKTRRAETGRVLRSAEFPPRARSKLMRRDDADDAKMCCRTALMMAAAFPVAASKTAAALARNGAPLKAGRTTRRIGSARRRDDGAAHDGSRSDDGPHDVRQARHEERPRHDVALGSDDGRPPCLYQSRPRDHRRATAGLECMPTPSEPGVRKWKRCMPR
jgi:hypothetical protein